MGAFGSSRIVLNMTVFVREVPIYIYVAEFVCLSLADEKPDDSMANLLTHVTKYFYVAFCVSSDHL